MSAQTAVERRSRCCAAPVHARDDGPVETGIRLTVDGRAVHDDWHQFTVVCDDCGEECELVEVRR